MLSYALTKSGSKEKNDSESNSLSSSSPPVPTWDRIIHKNVRTADNQPAGKVIAAPPSNEDTIIIITSQGSRGEYKVPKSCVHAYGGAEVILTNSE